jgi:hypothetical protein
MVQPEALNVFWRYAIHYIDYQAYVFRSMMVNEFGKRSYSCERISDRGCFWMFPSKLRDQCLVEGQAVLEGHGSGTGDVGRYLRYMIVIVAAYRVLGWFVLWVRKH